MIADHSIARRLFVGLSIVGIIGTFLLLVFVVREYEESFRALSDPIAAQHAYRELIGHVLLPIVLLIFPMGIASFIVIRRALIPLSNAAAQLRMTEAPQRGVLVDYKDFPAEVVPFAQAVNALLGQLEIAARDHEAFAADVAHELRTPLAVLALEMEVLEHPDASRLRAEVMAMRRLIEQLMLLARVEAQSLAPSIRAPVRLEDVAADIISLLAPVAIAEGRNLSLVRVGEAAEVMGQRETIAAALRNLVENALRVTPVGGSITVLAGPGPRLRVKDGGAGLTRDRLAELVKRHRRADHASSEGAGLGLAIVARIMVAHGGRLKTAPSVPELILDFTPEPRRAG